MSLTFQQLSTPSEFLRLNLKGFREESRVEHLVPNQIPASLKPVEICCSQMIDVEPVVIRSLQAVAIC